MRSSFIWLGLIFAGAAWAQTPPDAGTLQPQMGPPIPRAMPGESKPLISLPEAMPPSGDLSITVKTFSFTGNSKLSSAQLATVVEPYTNRPLDFAGLQEVTSAVAEAFRLAGWLVRVYLPRQEITDGIVNIQIVEARFGTLLLDGDAPTRLGIGQARAIVDAAQPSGQPLDANQLDRALLLIDDLPGVAASGNLVTGRERAETDLLLKLVDEQPLNGETSFDNTGSRATGSVRGSFNAYLNSPFKRGDLATVNLVHSEGSDYGRLAYSLPVGHSGLRIMGNGSDMAYRVVTPEFKALNLDGFSSTLGIDLQYPIRRTRPLNLYVSLGYEGKTYQNRSNGAITSDYGVRNINLGLTGNLFDRLGGGGGNFVSLTYTKGKVDLGTLDTNENAALNGNFTKLRYLASRQQELGHSLSLYAVLSGQVADGNLDTSEKFYLGGVNGVRAYPANEGGGSDGTLLNLELRWRAKNNFVLTGFYDWGQITQNHYNAIASAANPNRYILQGAGVSVAWTGPKGINLKGTYAHRISKNPNTVANGDDQDGSLHKHRVWLTASKAF